MKSINRAALAAPLFGASILAAGGASAQVTLDRQITFGDSLSDGGFFASVAPAGAGRFTTNPDPIWVEIVASELGLDLTPSVAGGLNFAIGGARVAADDPVVRSITEQINLFQAAGGTFGPNDLVTIQGGGNDIFAVGNGLATIDDLVASAIGLAGAVQQLKDLGAGTVIVTNVPTFDFYNVPFEATLAQLGPNALFIDVDQLFGEILANPSAFGFENVTDPACGGLSSLFCTPANYVTPNANETYALADDVHPTGRTGLIQADFTLAALRAPNMIDQLAFVGEGHLLSAQSHILPNLLSSHDEGHTFAFAHASGGKLEIDGEGLRYGADEDSYGVTFGVDTQVSKSIGLGASIAYRVGEGNFESNTGAFDTESFIGTGYGRFESGKFRAASVFSWGNVNFEDVSRNILLGILPRVEQGSTSASVLGAQIEIGYALIDGDWRLSPIAGLTHSDVDVDGYIEQAGVSTSLAFGDFDYSATRGFVGAEIVRNSDGVSPFVRVAYHTDLDEDDARAVTITPNEAPISFTTDGFTPSTDFVDVTGGITLNISEQATLGLVVDGEFSRDDISRYEGSLRFSFKF